MTTRLHVVVAGLGEVGTPLLQLISPWHDVTGVDLTPVAECRRADVLHVCYPFEIHDFVGETVRYIELFQPGITIINSTVAVGTTRAVANRSGAAIVNSPVRGKHACMLEELRIYTKFIGCMDTRAGAMAAAHFASVGVRTKVVSSPETTELAKLSETTYFGVLIAWAQEVERYCDQAGVSYEDVASFYDEIGFFPPVKYFPGVIGGHCVMPNITILKQFLPSGLLEAVERSNELKMEREARLRNEKHPDSGPVLAARSA